MSATSDFILHAANQTDSFEFDELDDDEGDVCYYRVRPADEYARTPGTIYVVVESIKDVDLYLYPDGEYDEDEDFGITEEGGTEVFPEDEGRTGVKYAVPYTPLSKVGLKMVFLPHAGEKGEYKFSYEFI